MAKSLKKKEKETASAASAAAAAAGGEGGGSGGGGDYYYENGKACGFWGKVKSNPFFALYKIQLCFESSKQSLHT